MNTRVSLRALRRTTSHYLVEDDHMRMALHNYLGFLGVADCTDLLELAVEGALGGPPVGVDCGCRTSLVYWFKIKSC